MHTRKRKAEAQAGSSSSGPLTKRQRAQTRSCKTDEVGAACTTLPTPLPSPTSSSKKRSGRPQRDARTDRLKSNASLSSSSISSVPADSLEEASSPFTPPQTRQRKRTLGKSGRKNAPRHVKEEEEYFSDASTSSEEAPSLRSFQTPLSSNRNVVAQEEDSSSCSSISSDDEDMPLLPRQKGSGINIETWRSTLEAGMEGQKRPKKEQEQLSIASDEESADALLERVDSEETADHLAFVARLVESVRQLVDAKEEQRRKEEELQLHEEDVALRPQSKKCLIAFKEAYDQVEVAFQEWKLLETLQEFEDRQVAMPTTRQRASSLASSSLSPEDATPPPLSPPRASPTVDECLTSPMEEPPKEVEKTATPKQEVTQKEEKAPRGRPPKVTEKKRRKTMAPEPDPVVVPEVPRFIGCGGLLSEWRKEIGGIYSLATPLHRGTQEVDTTEEETATAGLDTILADPDLAFLFSSVDVASPAKEIMKQYDMQVIDVEADEMEEIDAELAHLQNHPFGYLAQQEEEEGEEGEISDMMRAKKPKMALVKEDVSSPTVMDQEGSAFLDAFFGANLAAHKGSHAEEELRLLSSHDMAHLQELLDQALDLARLTTDVLQDPAPQHPSTALLDHVDELGQREKVLERLLGVVV